MTEIISDLLLNLLLLIVVPLSVFTILYYFCPYSKYLDCCLKNKTVIDNNINKIFRALHKILLVILILFLIYFNITLTKDN